MQHAKTAARLTDDEGIYQVQHVLEHLNLVTDFCATHNRQERALGFRQNLE